MPITFSYNNFSFTANSTELQFVSLTWTKNYVIYLKFLSCSYNPEMEV